MEGIEEVEGGNRCLVYYKKYPDPACSPVAIAPFAVVYLTLFVLGLAGNSLIIYVTLKNKTLQTVQNIFILNMAASDIMMCLLSVPITPVTNIYKNWYFGAVLCHLIPCIQGVSIFVCTFSLAAIAVDRYILVVFPHARPLSRHGAFVATIIMWVIAILFTVPYAFYMKMVSYEGVCGRFCTEHWPSATSRRAYTMIVMVFQFVVPFKCMAFCYLHIFFALYQRARVKLRKIDERSIALEQSVAYRTSNNGNEKQINGRDDSMDTFFNKQEKERQRLINQTRRTTSILVTMVVWFTLTWLPHNVVSLLIEYELMETICAMFFGEADVNYLVNLFTHCFAMSNIVVNPILYAWLNPTIRQLVVKTCISAKPKPRPFNRAYISMQSNGKTTDTTLLNTTTLGSPSMSPKEPSTLTVFEKKNVRLELADNDTFV